jgi:hypothetical protein
VVESLGDGLQLVLCLEQSCDEVVLRCHFLMRLCLVTVDNDRTHESVFYLDLVNKKAPPRFFIV